MDTPSTRARRRAAVLAGALTVSAAVSGCNAHKGWHCVSGHDVITYTMMPIGKTLVPTPRTDFVCDRWERNAPAKSLGLEPRP